VGLFDAVTVSLGGNGIALSANTKTVPTDSENLAHRAAALFNERAGMSRGVAIHLEKSIPVGAGLGGGSSDAAAVLLLLNEMTGAGYSSAELVKIGALLGSDVPFFCGTGPALATGRGERLAPLTVSPPFWVVLVTPGFFVSTAWAYNAYQGKRKRSSFPKTRALNMQTYGPRILVNDLEPVVTNRYQELYRIKEALSKCDPWGSLMSGSGSTVFGIFFDEGRAHEAQERIRADYGKHNWTVMAVPALV
jgi:4-diphosphocytidyl-2-C-methyl-D-erythritol kinase